MTKLFLGEWQRREGRVFVALDGSGREFVGYSQVPAGAMYWRKDPHCLHEPRCDRHLIAVCPNPPERDHWDIDGRASNCTMKDDVAHRCWVRHGEPPEITVDKNGLTCQAGAGSIMVPGYHGFIRGGFFTDG